MSQDFPQARLLAKGYDADQVEEFLSRAQKAYENDHDDNFTSWHVRTVGFDLRRLGSRYETTAVDAAFVRIEDAFAQRERQRMEHTLGQPGVQAHLEDKERALRSQLARPDRERFARGTGLELTYDIDQVDQLCAAMEDAFRLGQPMSAQTVRSAVFSSRRGSRGYRETPVDSFLDRAVELLTASQ